MVAGAACHQASLYLLIWHGQDLRITSKIHHVETESEPVIPITMLWHSGIQRTCWHLCCMAGALRSAAVSVCGCCSAEAVLLATLLLLCWVVHLVEGSPDLQQSNESQQQRKEWCPVPCAAVIPCRLLTQLPQSAGNIFVPLTNSLTMLSTAWKCT
jgi:hypothetical protein